MVRPVYKLEEVGIAEGLPGTNNGFTCVVFPGDKIPPGTKVFARVLQTPKCSCCGTTENLHDDFGSGGPYRCDNLDCLVY